MVSETKERSILFSGPMVRAILDGRKTQTRRVVKPQPASGVRQSVFVRSGFEDGHGRELRTPYGQPGDRLWVRECWMPACDFDPSPETGAIYRADSHKGLEKRNGDGKWRPSIHMPRWASRLTLEVTGVRVERLQDISPDDALSEGFVRLPVSGRVVMQKGDQHFGQVWTHARAAFEDLWTAINGADSWAANPWVWVVEFKRVGAGN